MVAGLLLSKTGVPQFNDMHIANAFDRNLLSPGPPCILTYYIGPLQIFVLLYLRVTNARHRLCLWRLFTEYY